jgi:hypothetical protein
LEVFDAVGDGPLNDLVATQFAHFQRRISIARTADAAVRYVVKARLILLMSEAEVQFGPLRVKFVAPGPAAK